MKFAAIFICVSLFAQDIPFKEKDEFELILDLQFRPRPKTDKVDFSGTHSTMPLPFLSMKLNVLKVLEDEYRVRIQDVRGNMLNSKQLSRSASIEFELGYTDDLKDGVASNKYYIRFIDRRKNLKRQIVITFDEDGTYRVNGEVRGKI